MTKACATWVVELNCTCPLCGDRVDLLDYADFWDGRKLDVPEHGTERSRDIDVRCPKCENEFTVDCEY